MASKKSRFCESRTLIKKVRKQGFECVETSKGYRVLGKDGQGQVTVHMTMSPAGLRDAMAALKRIGVQV